MTRRLLPAAVLLALAVPASAAAHARLLGSAPADGARLMAAPRRVVVTFDDTVRLADGNAAVANADGSSILARPASDDPVRAAGRTVVFRLRGGLTDGDYSIRWSIVSEDGHPEEGVLAFAVGSNAPRPTSILEVGGSSRLLVGLLKGLFFLGALVAAGITCFMLVCGRLFTGRAEEPAWTTAGRLMFVCLFTAFVGAGGLVQTTAGGTRYAHVYAAASVIAATAAAAAAIGARHRGAAAAARLLAVPLAAAPAFAGHALDAGQPFLVSPLLDLVHLGAAAAWFGGVAALVYVVPRATPDEGLRLVVARRFSRVAIAAAGLVAVSGAGRALVEFVSPGQLWSTSYGRVLLAKSALLVPLIVVAAATRRRLEAEHGDLRRMLRIELAVLVAIVAAATLLTLLRPGTEAPRRAAPDAARRAAPGSTAHPRTRRAHPARAPAGLA